MWMNLPGMMKKLDEGIPLDKEDIALLFQIPLFSDEGGIVQAMARRRSERASSGKAEIHVQVGLHSAPCPRNCLFCSFAQDNNIFTKNIELPWEDVLLRAKKAETAGANAVYLMATASYPFRKFIEISQEVRRALAEETIMVANIDDLSASQAVQLKDTGFAGIYHAVRLGEGTKSTIPVERRLETFSHVREAGLLIGTCLEPVGPEHTVEELVEKTLITRDARAVYSGAARRISLPGTELACHGMVSEAQMAHILSVVRLSLGMEVMGNCTHEPNGIGAFAGANLLWAESGANPRDTEIETSGHRGMGIGDCQRIFREAGWQVLAGPSQLFGKI
jgi:biotin synthase